MNACITLEGFAGRVDRGGYPPRPPSDPGLHITRTRFLISGIRDPRDPSSLRGHGSGHDVPARCPTQITPQAPACIAETGPPRISAAALLQLAQWCQSRRSESLGQSFGGPPCPTITAPQSPPALAARETSQASVPSLVVPTPAEASGTPAGAEPDHRQEPLSRFAEGGKL